MLSVSQPSHFYAVLFNNTTRPLPLSWQKYNNTFQGYLLFSHMEMEFVNKPPKETKLIWTNLTQTQFLIFNLTEWVFLLRWPQVNMVQWKPTQLIIFNSTSTFLVLLLQALHIPLPVVLPSHSTTYYYSTTPLWNQSLLCLLDQFSLKLMCKVVVKLLWNLTLC